METKRINRRSFLKLSALTSGGIVIAGVAQANGSLLGKKKINGSWQPNFWIKISPDNQITFICTQLEMGQGTSTGLSQILADELGADLNGLNVELADGDQKYDRLQDTGGSNGLADMWVPLRNAAAATREVLIKSAAKRWSIMEDHCYAEDGFVKRLDSSTKLTFGELLSDVIDQELPANPVWKTKDEFKYIGKSHAGERQRRIAKGDMAYSIDLNIPDMVYAVIERSPVVGGKVKSFSDTNTKKVKGVIDVFSYEGTEQEEDVFRGGARAGVVVVANSTWAAIRGRQALEIVWESGPNGSRGAENVKTHFENQISTGVERGRTEGAPDQYFAKDDGILKSNYEIYHQANVCMEPQNAIAHFMGDRVELWVGTQAPKLKQQRIAELLNWEPNQVLVRPYPCGGGFGRKFYCDYAEEAVLISQKIERPVKLMWTREDTVKTDRYHDLRVEHWKGVLDGKRIGAIDYVGFQTQPNGYRPFPYEIKNMGWSRMKTEQPYLNLFTSWRSVYAHHWIFGLETFMDEMAYQAEIDPLEFRLAHLNENGVVKQKAEWTREDLFPGRLKDCLRLVAEKGKWGRSMSVNSGQGVAVCSYNTAYCALMAEVTVNNGNVMVDKVVAAFDCGMAINPSQVKAQIEGSIIWGMSAIYSKIDITDGKTSQSNFHDYQLPRIEQSPEIEVHLIENEFAPSGSGEPAVPITAPAILNAVYAATGKRLTKIPISKEDLV